MSVTREEILVLGLTAGVVGSLVGGLMLGVGLGLAVKGAHIGWLLVLPAAPVAGLLGYVLARKLAKGCSRPTPAGIPTVSRQTGRQDHAR